MARGGSRPGAGRPKKNAATQQPAKSVTTANGAPAGTPPQTPLEYLLGVMNDPTADASRRDRAACAAAQYLHPKSGGDGKKGELQAAADKAMTGVFATPPAPRFATVTPLRGGK